MCEVAHTHIVTQYRIRYVCARVRMYNQRDRHAEEMGKKGLSEGERSASTRGKEFAPQEDFEVCACVCVHVCVGK